MRFAMKPTCLAKGPAHPPLRQDPGALRGNEASGRAYISLAAVVAITDGGTCIQTRQTPT